MPINLELHENFDGTLDGRYKLGDKPSLSLGYQPAGTAKPSDPNLVHDFNAVLESAYQGFFHLPAFAVDPHPDFPSVQYKGASFANTKAGSAGAISFNSAGTGLFVAGYQGGYDSDTLTGDNAGRADSICEIAIPTLTKPNDINDRTSVASATQTQGWKGVFTDDLTFSNVHMHTIKGLYLDRVTDSLVVHTMRDYDNTYNPENVVAFRTPSSLSGRDGYYSVRGSGDPNIDFQHCMGWSADIPSAWQSALGGRTLFGGQQTGSIIGRLPTGPTLFTGTFPASGGGTNVDLTRHMDFYNDPAKGKSMGDHFFPGRVDGTFSWYEMELFNADRNDPTPYKPQQLNADWAQIDPWINDWCTILSSGLQGFIIPNTNTYAVIGMIHGAESGIGYKVSPPWLGGESSGATRLAEDDYHNKYWLFDITDIQAATNPWEVFPYEHGYISMLDSMQTQTGARSQIVNAGFDLHTGQLAVVMADREDGLTSTAEADIVIFQTNSWQEAVI